MPLWKGVTLYIAVPSALLALLFVNIRIGPATLIASSPGIFTKGRFGTIR